MKRVVFFLLISVTLLCKTGLAQVISDTTGTLTWSLNTNDSALIITGKGVMPDYDYSDYFAPWHSYRSVIATIVIEDSVTNIGDCAFFDCSSLTSIIIPDSLTSIGKYAFWNCSNLLSINIPNSVTNIGDYAFLDCRSLVFVAIPDSITHIGSYLFYRCSSLTSVIIPNKVVNIGNYAFYSCNNLISINIPEEVTVIGNHAFYQCNKLTVINIPDKVTSIGDYAFFNCSNLKEINIGSSLANIGIYVFANCGNLESIEVKSDNTVFSSEYGILFNKPKTTLIQYPTGKNDTSYTLPNSVATIGTSAFRFCRLVSVNLPNSVITINDYAFSYCHSLTSVTIGNAVVNMGDATFFDCNVLAHIYSLSENPPIAYNNSTFLDVNKNTCVLQVPIGTKSKYADADGWKEFKIIQDNALKTNDIKNDSLTIYPNPTKGIIYFSKETNIKIYSIDGKFLQEVYGTEADLSAYRQGIYFFKLNDRWEKVVKN